MALLGSVWCTSITAHCVDKIDNVHLRRNSTVRMKLDGKQRLQPASKVLLEDQRE